MIDSIIIYIYIKKIESIRMRISLLLIFVTKMD